MNKPIEKKYRKGKMKSLFIKNLNLVLKMNHLYKGKFDFK